MDIATDTLQAPLSPTPRTTVRRGRKRAVTDRRELHALLTDGLVAHVGVTTGGSADGQTGGQAGGHPIVLPCAYAVDLDGPDDGGTLYLHGSVAASWLTRATGERAPLCVTVTELDGLVLARSGFHHSMNYRCAVVVGDARLVTDDVERAHALDAIVDHMAPGRSATLRPPTRKELAATAVVALPLAEASMKRRDGGPADDAEDVAAGGWAGHVPVRRTLGTPVTAADSAAAVPPHVRSLAR